MAEEMEKKTEAFRRIYSNLPVNERKSIIVILDEEPYSWNAAYIEITNKTELGKRILKVNRTRNCINIKN